MDFNRRNNLENKINNLLIAFQKNPLRLRKMNKKNEDKCDNIDEKENGIDEMQNLILDPRLHEN